MPRVPKQVVDRIRQTVHMDTVVEACGLGPVPHNRKIHSLANPDERTPSLHVYDDGWWDFSMGEGGSQIDFVMRHFGCSFPKAVQFLQGRAKLTAKPIETRAPRWQDLTERFFDEPEGNLNDFHKLDAYADAKWGLTPKQVFDSGTRLTAMTELWTPHYHPDKDDVVVGVKIRNLNSGSKMSLSGSTFTMGLYNPWAAPRCPDAMFLVEGESDTWALHHAIPKHLEGKWCVIGLPSGANTIRAEWFDRFDPGHWYVAVDADEAGDGAWDRIGHLVGRHRGEVYRITPPGGRVAEATMAGWNPVHAVRQVLDTVQTV